MDSNPALVMSTQSSPHPLSSISRNATFLFGALFSRLNAFQKEQDLHRAGCQTTALPWVMETAAAVEEMTASWSSLARVTKPGLSDLSSSRESLAMFTSKSRASA